MIWFEYAAHLHLKSYTPKWLFFRHTPKMTFYSCYNKLSVGYFGLKLHRHILGTLKINITSCKNGHNRCPLNLENLRKSWVFVKGYHSDLTKLNVSPSKWKLLYLIHTMSDLPQTSVKITAPPAGNRICHVLHSLKHAMSSLPKISLVLH